MFTCVGKHAILTLSSTVCMCVCVPPQICIMRMLKSEYVIRFFGQPTVGSVHYLFLEYADGGELFDRIGELNTMCASVILISVCMFGGVAMCATCSLPGMGSGSLVRTQCGLV